MNYSVSRRLEPMETILYSFITFDYDPEAIERFKQVFRFRSFDYKAGKEFKVAASTFVEAESYIFPSDSWTKTLDSGPEPDIFNSPPPRNLTWDEAPGTSPPRTSPPRNPESSRYNYTRSQGREESYRPPPKQSCSPPRASRPKPPPPPPRSNRAVPSPYEVLGVSQGSSQSVVKAAYSALVRKNHPDVPGGSTEKTSIITAAWTEIKKRNGWN